MNRRSLSTCHSFLVYVVLLVAGLSACGDSSSPAAGDKTKPREASVVDGPRADAAVDLASSDHNVTGPDRKVTSPDQKVTTPDQKVTTPDQKVTTPDQKVTIPDQKVATPDQKVTTPDQKVTTPDQKVATPDQKVTIPDQKVTTPDQKPSPDVNSCGPDFTPCTATGSKAGFCRQGACVVCTGATVPASDADCVKAYGTGFICVSGGCMAGNCHGSGDCAQNEVCVSNQCGPCSSDGQCTGDAVYGVGYICGKGSCVKGNCKTSADCTGANAGQICGVTTPFNCGVCSSDPQCAADTAYGTALGICISGKCSSNVCISTGGAASLCAPAGTTDVCCANLCYPGTNFTTNSCCGTGQSTCGAGQTCVANNCTSCPAPPTNAYYVDPINGGSSGPTGANQKGCQFKSLTRLFQYLGAAGPNVATKVYLLADTGTASGEVFPLVVPKNVQIVGADGAGAAVMRTVTVPTGALGFFLSQPGSSLSHLVITGGATGVSCQAVAPSPGIGGPSIDHVTVTGGSNNGIVAGAANGTTNLGCNLSLGAGVRSDGNFRGLLVGGSAWVTITGGTGADQTSFSNNQQHGIQVQDTGTITLTGAVSGTPVSGTVVTNANVVAGLFIRQNPGSAAPACVVKGLLSYGTTAGNGIRVEGGSKVVLRNSVAINNSGSGLSVTTFNHAVNGVPVISDDVSGINVGTATSGNDAGGNTLQVATTSTLGGRNFGAGICLQVAPSSGAVLKAEGNTLVSTTNVTVTCSGAAAVLSALRACAGSVAVGIQQPVGVGTPNNVDVASCSFVLP